jgi:hypothetical protein
MQSGAAASVMVTSVDDSKKARRLLLKLNSTCRVSLRPKDPALSHPTSTERPTGCPLGPSSDWNRIQNKEPIRQQLRL